MSSTSLKLRKEGNEIFQSISETMPFLIKEGRLLNCLKLYRDSVGESQTRHELSSALKNVSVVTFRLFKLYAEKNNSQIVSFYAKETQIESLKAFEAGEHPSAQNYQWLTHLKAKQIEAARSYIDYLWTGKFQGDLEEKVHLMVKLRNISADHVKCWINYQIAETYYKSSINLRDLDLHGSFRSINECNYYFEECLKLLRHSEPVFDINTIEFTSDLAIQLCIVESLKYKRIADKNIDKILNDNENLDIEGIWDSIDLYHEAICKAKDKNIELEAEVLSLLGTIYKNILKLKTRGNKLFKACFNLTESLKPKLFTKYKWYKDCLNAIEASQEEVVKEEEKKLQAEKEKVKDKISADLEKIKKEFEKDNSRSFVSFIYINYPPKNGNKCPDELDTFDTKKFKTVSKKSLIDYHEDKNLATDYGYEWFFKVREISKYLGRIYENLK